MKDTLELGEAFWTERAETGAVAILIGRGRSTNYENYNQPGPFFHGSRARTFVFLCSARIEQDIHKLISQVTSYKKLVFVVICI